MTDFDEESVEPGEYTYDQQSACIALQDWAMEALKRGVAEDDVRDSFEKALDVARSEFPL